ncbi:hypothetical protein Mapa_012652 [Marchantia paleacea]|nr:hypothetical protein Mapa_012652 [Marchantia paleacea]
MVFCNQGQYVPQTTRTEDKACIYCEISDVPTLYIQNLRFTLKLFNILVALNTSLESVSFKTTAFHEIFGHLLMVFYSKEIAFILKLPRLVRRNCGPGF